MTTTVNPPAFVLSATLRAHGFNLTDEQSLLLDVAQKMHNGFKERTPIPVRMLKRILQAYHSVPMAESKAIMQELEDIGLVELLTNENGRHDVKLIPKFRGLSDEELTEENAGIGVRVTTLRERAEEFEFRNRLLKLAAWSQFMENADCSIEAAMLLDRYRQMACIDQVVLTELKAACKQDGLTDVEFCCACCELEGNDALSFYWDENTQTVYAKTLYPVGSQFGISVSSALEDLS